MSTNPLILNRNRIEVAAALLARIAMVAEQAGHDPGLALKEWREKEGIDEDGLWATAMESAQETLEEIEAATVDGEMSMAQARDFLARDYVTAFMIAWIARSRIEARANT